MRRNHGSTNRSFPDLSWQEQSFLHFSERDRDQSARNLVSTQTKTLIGPAMALQPNKSNHSCPYRGHSPSERRLVK